MPQTPFNFLLTLLSMVIPVLIIYYLKNLETIGCKCAMNYKRTYIMYFTIFNLVFGLSNLLSGGRVNDYIVKSPYGVPIVSVLAAAVITNIVFTLMYIEELKKDNCECSESVFRTMMYIVSIIAAAVWGLILLSAIMLGGLVISMPMPNVPTLKAKK